MGAWLFFIALMVIVMIHESGHFLTAKMFDFKATKFFVGFGPTLWSVRRGETEYGVKALPLGGFVKIIGMNPYEEVPPEDQPRSYPNKPRWQRAIVLVAGSATHWLIAFVVLAGAGIAFGVPTDEATNEIRFVEGPSEGETTPAAEAGLQPGDRIVGLGSTRTRSWDEISSFIREHPEKRVEFLVERGGRAETLNVRLGKALFDDEGVVEIALAGQPLRDPKRGEEVGGFLGVSPELEHEQGVVNGVSYGFSGTWELTKLSVLGIKGVFGPVFNGELFRALSGDVDNDERPIGLVGAGRLANQTASAGRWLQYANFIAGFAVFIGVINLLPLPPLDGGHLAVVGWEAVTGRTVDIRRLIPVAATVISFFVLLFLVVLYLDLSNPVELPL